MKRRAVLFGVLAAILKGQERESDDVLAVLAGLAQALSTGSAAEFLEYIDRGFPDYNNFRRQIHALLEQWDVAASIEPLRGSGTGGERSIELDWYVELRAKPPSNRLIRRRELVTLRLVRNGRKWKVGALSPVSLLSPIVPEVQRNSSP